MYSLVDLRLIEICSSTARLVSLQILAKGICSSPDPDEHLMVWIQYGYMGPLKELRGIF